VAKPSGQVIDEDRVVDSMLILPTILAETPEGSIYTFLLGCVVAFCSFWPVFDLSRELFLSQTLVRSVRGQRSSPARSTRTTCCCCDVVVDHVVVQLAERFVRADAERSSGVICSAVVPSHFFSSFYTRKLFFFFFFAKSTFFDREDLSDSFVNKTAPNDSGI